MAWFQQSLGDMKKAIEEEDWPRVEDILRQHNRTLARDSPMVEHDLSSIHLRIAQYGEDLDQINRALSAQKRGRNTKDIMLLKVDSAINEAYFFERTIIHLISERKFMDQTSIWRRLFRW